MIVLGERETKVYEDLFLIYGNERPSRATIFRFVYGFKKVSYTIVGRPMAASTDENVQIIEDLITEDRYLSYRRLSAKT